MRQTFLLEEYSLDAMVSASLALLRKHEPAGGYHGCFSGGKDSIVIKQLALEAGVSVEWHYNVTTLDPPEVVHFIRREHPDVVFDRPKHGNFFARMEVKGPPTRRARWCCAEYKEAASPKDALLILGIRGEESPRRANMWSEVHTHTRTGITAVLPILRWGKLHVWDFIYDREMPYCSLYDEGFDRLGCVGCPMAGREGRVREFARWPKYERMWKRSFERIWTRRAGTTRRDGLEWFGSAFFRCWEEMWDWWMSDDGLPVEDESQCAWDFDPDHESEEGW
jgi:phosphoadenosine phosphosulfate reductase